MVKKRVVKILVLYIHREPSVKIRSNNHQNLTFLQIAEKYIFFYHKISPETLY